MLHYHGTPVTPEGSMSELVGRCFCVSFATHTQGKDVLGQAHRIGQAVMLDNGAYTFWRQNVATTPDWWDRYYDWCRPWLDYHTTWAVIPDLIDGTEQDNDDLLIRFTQRFGRQGAPVWHLHESLDRLMHLCVGYDRVCFGSSGQYADPQTDVWRHRVDQAFNRIAADGKPRAAIHMLRAMREACEGPWPFASADSTNIARNHHRHRSPRVIADWWDGQQPPARWVPREQLELGA